MVSKPNNAGKGCFSFISKTLSLTALKLSTLLKTQLPGDAIFLSSSLFKLYVKSSAFTTLVESLPNKKCL